MSFLAKILGIDALREKIERERGMRKKLEEKLDIKYDDLVKFSIALKNSEIADFKFKLKRNEKRIDALEKSLLEYVSKEELKKLFKIIYLSDEVQDELEKTFEEYTLAEKNKKKHKG
ncbi:MAG: hypothetical protein ACE5K0_00620 [Candidatus Methanofastidiosia archaeon]